MNIELTLALIVLFFGSFGFIKVLKSGNQEDAIKRKEEDLKKSKESLEKQGVYIAAWFSALVIYSFLLGVSLTYIYSLV